MDSRAWVIAVIGCITDFILAAGGAFGAVVVENHAAPSMVTLAVVVVTGLMASARRLQALVQLPPLNGVGIATSTKIVGALLIVALAPGCATLVKVQTFAADDFRAAALEGKAAREHGDLPKGDLWPECYDEIAARLAPTPPTVGPTGIGVLTMRAHILKARSAQPVSGSCAQVILDLERDGVKVFGSIVPGGSLLPQ